MSLTGELLKAKQKFITHNKCYPTHLLMTSEYQEQLKQDMVYKRKASANGNLYVGCYIKLVEHLETPFQFVYKEVYSE